MVCLWVFLVVSLTYSHRPPQHQWVRQRQRLLRINYLQQPKRNFIHDTLHMTEKRSALDSTQFQNRASWSVLSTIRFKYGLADTVHTSNFRFRFLFFFSHVLSHVMTHIGLYTGPGVSMYISECFFSWNRRLEDIHNQVRR